MNKDHINDELVEEVEEFIEKIVDGLKKVPDDDNAHVASVERDVNASPVYGRKQQVGYRVNSTIIRTRIETPNETWVIEREQY